MKEKKKKDSFMEIVVSNFGKDGEVRKCDKLQAT